MKRQILSSSVTFALSCQHVSPFLVGGKLSHSIGVVVRDINSRTGVSKTSSMNDPKIVRKRQQPKMTTTSESNDNVDMLTMKTIPLQHLSNSIQWTTTKEGRIHVIVSTKPPTSHEDFMLKASSLSYKQETTTIQNSASSNDTNSNSIPQSVLQYERQLRKIQAQTKSVQPLNLQDHLKIVYEDPHLIVVNKPSGVLCVPGLHNKPNLLDLVRQYLLKKEQIPEIVGESSTSPPPPPPLFHSDPSKMIVHRLDMDTSGIVVFAKTEESLKQLQRKFRDRSNDIIKEYHALLCSHIEEDEQGDTDTDPNVNTSTSILKGDIYLPLQRDHEHPPFMRIATPQSELQAQLVVKDLQTYGFQKLIKKKPKQSQTEFHILQREWIHVKTENNSSSLPVTRVLLIPHTGRTHQLRVHMAAIGYPIVGDPAYGLFGEANSKGGISSMLRNDHDNDPINDEQYGASIELQKQILEAWPASSKPMCLHASRLSMEHPITQQVMDWRADIPF